jgi:hypothetical protein
MRDKVDETETAKEVRNKGSKNWNMKIERH